MKRQGHQEAAGETIAKFEFWQQGWNPFEHFVDDDQVDLILRRNQNGRVEYREIQVKFGRFYAEDMLAPWQRKFFKHVAWRTFDPDEFARSRPELIVAMVLGGSDGLKYDGDIFLFRSRELHDLIQAAPRFSTKDERKNVYIGCAINGDRWYVPKQRTKFDALSPEKVMDVTAHRRNFKLLESVNANGAPAKP
jgi:hypothetical protein